MPFPEVDYPLLRPQDVAASPRRKRLAEAVLEDFLPGTIDLKVHRRVADRLGGDEIKVAEKDGGLLIQGVDGHGTMSFWREYSREVARGPVRKLLARVVWDIRKRIRGNSPQSKPQA